MKIIFTNCYNCFFTIIFLIISRCTALYGTPTMFVDILNLPELKSYDLSSLSTGYMAGAPCPQSLVKAVVNDLHMKDFVVRFYKFKIISISVILFVQFAFLGGLWYDRN